MEDNKGIGNIAFFITIGILVAVIGLSIYLFTAVLFKVSVQGNSMNSTLSSEDVLIVNRKAEVERGDVVVISKNKDDYSQWIYPDEKGKLDLTTLNYPCIKVVGVEEWFNANHKNKSLTFKVDGNILSIDNPHHQIKIIYQTEYSVVKRVIGLEGDTVKIEKGKVYLKKAGESVFQVLQEDYLDRICTDHGYTSDKDDKCSVCGKITKSIETHTYEGHPKEWTVGANEVFYLGDNRINSEDSRSDGCCKLTEIEGVVSKFSIWIKPITTWFGKLFS